GQRRRCSEVELTGSDTCDEGAEVRQRCQHHRSAVGVGGIVHLDDSDGVAHDRDMDATAVGTGGARLPPGLGGAAELAFGKHGTLSSRSGAGGTPLPSRSTGSCQEWFSVRAEEGGRVAGVPRPRGAAAVMAAPVLAGLLLFRGARLPHPSGARVLGKAAGPPGRSSPAGSALTRTR